MEADYGYPPAGGERAMRAADVDRERMAEFLNAAYVEGRLTREEHDARLDAAFAARTYADLDQIASDLPMAPGAGVLVPVPGVAPHPAKTNGLAIASLAFALGQFVFGPVATIPAIVLGHVARRQIARTGEPGAGLALAGLIIGWVALIVGIAAVVAGLAAFATMRGTFNAP